MRYIALFSLGIGIATTLQADVAPQMRVQNLESEVSYLKQKIENQEARLESVREEITKLVKATKELTSSQTAAAESKVKLVEKNLEKLVADMKQFKSHANETNDLVKELQKAIARAQENGQLQAKQVEGLEVALKSLAKAMQGDVKSSSSSKSYRVKKGDTLEKIAKEFQTTASAIKEANALSSNTIQKDQELRIP